MNNDIQLRRVTPVDLPLLQQVGADSYRPYYPHVWHPGGMEWYVNYCFGKEALLADFAQPAIEYYFPLHPESGAIMGLLKVLPEYPVPDSSIKNAFFLEKIYLLPDFFGQGYGQLLINMVIERARSLGREAVWLKVMNHPAPIRAYEKAGFAILGPTYFNFEQLLEHERQGWVMVRRLP